MSLWLLGGFQAVADDVTVTAFGADKARALLAYLAVEANRPHERRALAALLWPDWPEEAALGHLRRTLHRLRRALELASPAAADMLVANRQVVHLAPDRVECDVRAFRALLAACRSHEHDRVEGCAACLSRMQQAVELYGGPFLADSAEALYTLGRLDEARERNNRGMAYLAALGHADHMHDAEDLAARIEAASAATVASGALATDQRSSRGK